MENTDAPILLNTGVTSTDRIAMTLFLAIAFHAIVILGITFGAHDDPPPENIMPTLDITLTSKRTPPPDEADYLAQTSQDGGGNVTEKIQPTMEVPEQAPAVQPQLPTPAPTEVVTTDAADIQVMQEDTQMPEKEQPDISAAELIERSMEMVNLSEKLNETMQAYAQRPKQVYVSARTQEYKYANYMREWVKKVERVGNTNYPDAARRQGISGKLLMDVALNADGTVRNISILRPAGHKVIDEAAIRIVNLAAPFPPFPPEIGKDADVLHITRTWEFSSSNRLQSH